jgi:hypothetical protein
LAELLRRAKQYEMESVRDQLREWFIKLRMEDGFICDLITDGEPLAAFVVDISFDGIDEVQYAHMPSGGRQV